MEKISYPKIEDFSKQRLLQAFNETKTQFPDAQCDIVLVTGEYYDRAIWMAEHAFHPYDPLSKSIGLQWNDEVYAIWMNTFKEHLSFMMIDRETREPMCLRATRLQMKGQVSDLHHKMNDCKSQSIIDFLHFCDNKKSFFDYYKTNWNVHFFGLCTSPKYRKKGHATTLMKFSMEVLQNLQMFPLYIKGEASSNYSKTIYEKLNFELYSEVKFSDYKVVGKVVFDNTSPHTSMRSYGYIINNPVD